MPGKGKKRREARRRAKQRREEQSEAASPRVDADAEEAPIPSAKDARRAEGQVTEESTATSGQVRRARKRRRRDQGVGLASLQRLRLSPWLLAVPVLGGIVAFVVIGVIGSGSSGITGNPLPSPTADPRVAGQTPAASITIQAGDNFFQPTSVTANAGEVIELVLQNNGAASHNLRVAGPDDEYETADDFAPQPRAVGPGEQGTTLVKIDEPGSYRFRCDFHPIQQIGTLVLR